MVLTYDKHMIGVEDIGDLKFQRWVAAIMYVIHKLKYISVLSNAVIRHVTTENKSLFSIHFFLDHMYVCMKA